MTEEVESPCIGLCHLDNGKCAGCHRTTEEVVDWYNYTNEQKQAVIDRLFDEE